MQSVIDTRKSIQQLSLQLANQIAAGEVVERPASVVKELLENCLDAGATQIDIDIQNGGTLSIRIKDNGSGIPKDELSLALSPHATSKIESLDDLIHINSMGFRGEALASIASVSKMSLTSFFDDMAWKITSKQGQFETSPASHPPGTTVEVNDLFYNTPARRKFLRSERTEYRYIEDVVKRIALSHFDVAINFKHNQRQIWSLAAANSSKLKIQRLSRLINKEFISAAVELNYENAGLRLSGWIASASYSRSQSDMQYFFVNGRIIRDKVITHAVRQAYEEKLYPGRYPVYVLHLQMDAEQVDVNVHPTKHEVRFRQSRLIHDFIFHSLHQALNHNPVEITATEKTGVDKSSEENKSDKKLTANNYNSAQYPTSSNSTVAEFRSSYSKQKIVTDNISIQVENINKPLGYAISVLSNNYLLSRNKPGLLVVNLTAARRYILNQQIKTHLSEQNKLISKPVLIPFSINLSVSAESWLNIHKAKLQQLGFELAILGENELMVRQVPALLNAKDLKSSVNQYIQNSLGNNFSEETSYSDALIELVIQEDFSELSEDWNLLLRELEKFDDAGHLYHQLEEQDFEKWF